MPNLNRVMLMGNLTRDPELRYLPSNMPVVNFGLATGRRWRTPEGEQKEETTFVECSAFARTAEVINQYMKKGRPIYVEGRLRYEQWQDKESGANRSKLSVVVENFQFLDSRGGDEARMGDGANQDGGGAPPSSYQPRNAPAQQAPRGMNRTPQGAPMNAGPVNRAPAPAPAQTMEEPHQAVEEADIPF